MEGCARERAHRGAGQEAHLTRSSCWQQFGCAALWGACASSMMCERTCMSITELLGHGYRGIDADRSSSRRSWPCWARSREGITEHATGTVIRPALGGGGRAGGRAGGRSRQAGPPAKPAFRLEMTQKACEGHPWHRGFQLDPQVHPSMTWQPPGVAARPAKVCSAAVCSASWLRSSLAALGQTAEEE
jgi:hypothetical protein